MRKSIITITAILIICASAAAQPDTLWTRTYGGSNTDFGYSVQQTTDGGYIIAGYTTSYGAGAQVYLIKTDAFGNLQWYRTLSAANYGHSVQQTSDGGYIIAGHTQSYGAGDFDVSLIKTDTSGFIQWYHIFGGTEGDYGYSVQQTTDEGYIVVGYTNSYSSGSQVYLIKTDTNGDSLWTKTFGGNFSSSGYSVRQNTDGGYIIAGCTNLGTSVDVYLIKTDAYGDSLWTKTFGGSEEDYGYSVQQTNDGGYIIAGYTQSYGAGSRDVYLIKTDADGNQQWYRTFGGISYDEGLSIQLTSDCGYIIAGYTESYGTGICDVYLIKTDDSGNQQWSQTFGGINAERGWSVQQTSGGGYIIVGYTNSYGAGGSDVYLIKLASEYCLTFNPEFIDFGVQVVGETVIADAIIINPSEEEIIIDSVYNSFSVFTFDSIIISEVIPAGDSLEVAIIFVPDSSVVYSDFLYIFSGDFSSYLPLSGTGTGAYISLSDDSLDFGYWELNAPYPTRDFSIANLGNDTLEVDSIISGNPAFILTSGTGLTLPPGAISNPVAITFQPPVEGFHEGYILLPNNTYNIEDDTAMVYVSGWWEYTPAPVYDLTVGIEGIDAVLNWSPVDTSIYGNPITVDTYIVFYSEIPYAPDSLYFFHGNTSDTTYTHENVAFFSENMFYQVIAYIGEIGILDEITAGDEPISRTELLEEIFTGNKGN